MSASDAFDEQRRLYGASVGDLVRRITTALHVSQAATARVLGLSPAMLSQLVGGHRVKIGNPLVLARLQALHELASSDPVPSGADLEERLAAIADSRETITTRGADAPDGAEVVRRLLHAVASGRDLQRAAEALDDAFPEIATVLRAYGTGSAADARRHFASYSRWMG